MHACSLYILCLRRPHASAQSPLWKITWKIARYGELVFKTADGKPLDVDRGAFTVGVWQVRFPWYGDRAALLTSSSPALDAVWALNQNAVKVLTIDLYTDSNARQRSADCQADAAVAAQAQSVTAIASP